MISKIKHLKDNFYYVDIAKNASSTLRNIKYFYDNKKEFNGNNYQLWNLYKFNDDFQSFINDDNNRLICVLRNPIDRLISYYLNLKKCQNKYVPLIKNFNDMVMYANMEAHTTNSDPHIQPQYINYLYYEKYITDVIMIENLSDFLKNNVHTDYFKIVNSFNHLYDNFKYEFTEDLINQIKNIYKEDFLLIKNLKNK